MNDARHLLDRLNPFHVLFDGEFRILHVGPALQRLLTCAPEGNLLGTIVRFRDVVLTSTAALASLESMALLADLLTPQICLRGQFLAIADDAWAFCSTPWMSTEASSGHADLTLSAPHESWADQHLMTQLLLQQQEDLKDLVGRLLARQAELETHEAVLRNNRQQLANAMSLAKMADWEFDGQRGIFLLNDRIYVLFGTTVAREGGYEVAAETFFREFGDAEGTAHIGEQFRKAVTARQVGILRLECRLRRRDNGAVLHALLHYEDTRDAAGRVVGAFGSLLDITDRREAELAREASEVQLKAVIDSALDAIVILNNEQRIVFFNASAERIFGRTATEMLGQPLDLLIPSPLRRRHQQHLSGLATAAGAREMGPEMALMALRADGAQFPIESSISSVLVGDRPLFIASIRDITARKAAEAERQALQVQLNRSQKLDSIGQLAGGIAHDFNNMLNVILGTTALALEAVPVGEDLHADLVEIRTAAERSATLTRQLLAFARQEAIAPRRLDLNETVASMLTMLRRLLGEDLTMTWVPGENLGHVKMDPSQVDQLLANLCLNARDAVIGVGTVSIRTANATLDQARLQGDSAPVSGAFVLLSVSDSGSGMNANTLGQIFEPFFTTKEVGKGTGLGLATVYGIVKQNGGGIDVVSELGKGTTFSIYLPREDSEDARPTLVSLDRAVGGGGETVLLVDDEPAMLSLCKRFLTSKGYTVLTANTPREALTLAAENCAELRLLITDVIMPEMSGHELSEQINSLYPEIRCLFMSGYTADIIATRGVLDEGVAFIQKPFLMNDFGAKVRSTLDAPVPARPTAG